jgi:Tol biopolymer transport system component
VRVILAPLLALSLLVVDAGTGRAASGAGDPGLDPAATERASISIVEAQANGLSLGCDMTPDGRFVVFSTTAPNLVPFDTNGSPDVFVRDRQIGSTERVSVSSAGAQGNGTSGFTARNCAISDDGRFVAFGSLASNLVAGDTYGRHDIFVRERQAGTTVRLSGAGGGFSPTISGDGRFVAFASDDALLVPGDTNGVTDVFLRERATGAIERLSVSGAGVQGDAASRAPALDFAGRLIAFGSFAANLVPGDTNNSEDVFVRDRVTGTTERASVSGAGAQGNSASSAPVLSADGRVVAFTSLASNLTPGSSGFNLFLRDRQVGAIERVSDGSGGFDITPDGRYVLFSSGDATLVPGDTNNQHDVFLRDRQAGLTIRVSVGANGTQGNGVSTGIAVSADGRLIAFQSDATNLVSNDTNGDVDVFVRNRCRICLP